MHKINRIAAALAAVGLSLALTPAVPAVADQSRRPLPVPWTAAPLLTAAATDWNGTPPGANDWSCRPTAQHPRPVVLAHGTLASMSINFQTISPYLYNKGYCVFALNYGRTPFIPPGVGGIAHVRDSAIELGRFVDRVLAATGAPAVDLVGHSGGGLIPQYYVQKLDGAGKVHTRVGLAPGNHALLYGVDVPEVLYGILRALPGGIEIVQRIGGATLPYVGDIFDARFWRDLYPGGDSVPGVHYTNIVSRYDPIIRPSAGFQAAAPNVRNLTVQDYCPIDFADHVALAYDPTALGLIANALDPAHATRPECRFVAPFLG